MLHFTSSCRAPSPAPPPRRGGGWGLSPCIHGSPAIEKGAALTDHGRSCRMDVPRRRIMSHPCLTMSHPCLTMSHNVARCCTMLQDVTPKNARNAPPEIRKSHPAKTLRVLAPRAPPNIRRFFFFSASDFRVLSFELRLLLLKGRGKRFRGLLTKISERSPLAGRKPRKKSPGFFIYPFWGANRGVSLSSFPEP